MPPATLQRHKGLITILGVALFILFLLLYFAPYGCRNYLILRTDLSRVKAELNELQSSNKRLTEEITLLKNDSKYVEKVARQKLGMLKKNEIIFEEPEKKAKNE